MSAADLQGAANKVNPFILEGYISLTRVDAALVTTEEIPAENEVVDQVTDYSAIRPHMSSLDAKCYVDNAQGLNLATITASSGCLGHWKLMPMPYGANALTPNPTGPSPKES